MLEALDEVHLNELIAEIASSAQEIVQQSNAKLDSIERIIELDMLYAGQTHAVAVPIISDQAITIDTIQNAFEESYLKAYSRLLNEIPIRILNLKLSIIGKRPQIDVKMLARGPRAESVETCRVTGQEIFSNGQWHDAAIYDRLLLPQGSNISGPALLVQPDATIYIDPGLYAVVDDFGNIIMKEEDA